MWLVLDVILVVGTLVLLIPSVVFMLECVASVNLNVPLGPPRPPESRRARFAVLIPAHDESTGIGPTLDALDAHLNASTTAAPRPRVVLVADNCSDNTAALARERGVEVIERQDAERRGKGYAIVFGLEHLDADPPDVVVVFDADCRVTGGALQTLADEALAGDRPVQAEYLIESPSETSPTTAISAFALVVRNRTRPRGLARFGLPVGLTGTGMAFPWKVIREAPELGAYLVEDLMMGIEMAIAGRPPKLSTATQVRSVLPSAAASAAALGQRRRWEHGQLTTLVQQVPRILALAARRRNLDLLAIGLDLAIPPLAFFVMIIGAELVVTLLAGLLGATWLSAFIAALSFLMVGIGVVAAWLRHGRQTISGKQLLAAPLYVLWKIPIYLEVMTRKTVKTWDRTDRD